MSSDNSCVIVPYPGFFPRNEVAGDEFIVGSNQALARLGKAVAFLFARSFRTQHYQRLVTSVVSHTT